MPEYRTGQAITDTATFRDSAGAAADPTTVTATLLKPDGTSTAPAVTSGGTGVRTVTFTPDQPGTWVLTWAGTGAVAAKTVAIFVVLADYSWSATDILTLDEAKREIGMTADSTAQDARLPTWVGMVSKLIDAKCGPVVVRTVTDVFDADEGSQIVLRQWPAKDAAGGVTTMTTYTGGVATVHTAETLTASAANSYLFDALTGIVRNRASFGDRRYNQGDRVEVVYQAGRYANTAAVSAQFKGAAGALIRRLWQGESGGWARGGDPYADTPTTGFGISVDPVFNKLLWDQLLPRIGS